MKSLKILSDEKLMTAYRKSIQLGLEKDFINLLHNSIVERNLENILSLNDYSSQTTLHKYDHVDAKKIFPQH